jgi:plastocyanin
MRRLRPALAVLCMAALAVLWLALPGLAQSKGVLTQDTTLSPSSVTITPGDSVTWSNVSNNVHNLIGSSDNWPTGERFLVPGSSTTIEFNLPGTYSYYCEYHPATMRGTVGVSEDPSPEPSDSPSPSPSPSSTVSPSPSPSTSPSPSVSPTPSATPTQAPTESPSPSTSPTLYPTELPSFGSDEPGGPGPGDPQLAAGSRTPPPDSPLKPPLTILGALVLILLFAANPMLKARPHAERVPVAPPAPRRSRP